MNIQNPLRCILLWLILIVTMVLHFNYHVGEIFYGIDVVRPDSNGSIPIGTHLVRNVFYHLPILWIIILIYKDTKSIRMGLFAVSMLYTLSHLMHLIGELTRPDFSQMPLLTIALGVSILLNIEQYKYWKSV